MVADGGEGREKHYLFSFSQRAISTLQKTSNYVSLDRTEFMIVIE